MSKKYTFRMNAQLAEFKDGMVGVVYGGPETYLGTAHCVGTLAEAVAEFGKFTDAAKAPCTCFLSCRDNPLPRGYNAVKRSIDKNVPATQQALASA